MKMALIRRKGRNKMSTYLQQDRFDSLILFHIKRWKNNRNNAKREHISKRKFSRRKSERKRYRPSETNSKKITTTFSQIVNRTANNNDKNEKLFFIYLDWFIRLFRMFCPSFSARRQCISSMIIIITPSGKYSECHLQFLFVRIKSTNHVSLWWTKTKTNLIPFRLELGKHHCNFIVMGRVNRRAMDREREQKRRTREQQ